MKNLWNGKVKYLIPTPTLCPDCRRIRRYSWRNERKLYKRKCNATGENIVSIYSPDKPYIVYEPDFWWSDKWNALDYGKKFDFSQPFFEQFKKLFHEVPRISLFWKWNEYSHFTNHTDGAKNCYMCFDTANSENILYENWIVDSNNCLDSFFLMQCSFCFQSMHLENCYNCYFSFYSNDCSNCFYIYNCRNCQDCLYCSNLNNKQYYIFNKQYDSLSFEQEKKKLLNLSEKEEQQKFDNFILKTIRKALSQYSCENVSGDFLWNCKNLSDSYVITEWKNLKFCDLDWWITDSYDTFESAFESEFQYECHACNRWKTVIWGHVSYDVNHCFYIDSCHNSSDLFGCIWLRNKQYCILNKQYTKEEYEKLVPKIIENMMTPPQSPSIEGEARNEQGEKEWGEFFPSSLSSFGYNETVANEYFPLIRDVALQYLNKDWKQVFNRSDYESPFPKVEKIIPANKLPENIKEIPDYILNLAIECEITKKPFRIIAQELNFYRKHNLPIPRRHPDQRHLDRMELRNPRKLFMRKCDKCGKEIQTTYAPERPEIVYCEECYEKEIY